MADINRTSLNKVVKSYIESGDVETAKSYIRTWGVQIKGFKIQKELDKVDEMVNKRNRANKRRK